MKRIDLHIHTISTNKDHTFEFDIKKLTKYVEKCNLNAIAITNHNLFDREQFEEIQRNLNIIVFPGIEIDLENGHIIVISNKENIDLFEEQCQKVTKSITNSNKYLSYDEFINIFSNIGDYLLIPHYKKHPALQQIYIKKLRENIFVGEVDSIKKFYLLKKKENDLVPVYFSDIRISEDMNEFPRRFTYINVQEISFNSIKYALKDKTKVFLNELKDDSQFVFNTDGLLASTKLNIIMGKRSSGKTYLLNNIQNNFSNSKIKYIKQFEITEKSGNETFDKITKIENEKITNEYIKPISEIISKVIDIDLDHDNDILNDYCEKLLDNAINTEKKDVFSSSKLFNETIYDSKENLELKELINAIICLLDSDTYKEIIDKHIGIDSLRNILEIFIKDKKVDMTNKKLKDFTDEIIKLIQDKLEIKSSVTSIPQTDFYNIIKNKIIIERFNNDIVKIMKNEIVYEKEVQRFKIRATKEIFKNVSTMKSCSGATGSLQVIFDNYYTTNPFEYIKQLRKAEVSLDSLGKAFIQIKYDVLNSKKSNISGGEKAEYNLIRELEDSLDYDMLLLDEPESSFDNPYLKEKINSIIKDISNKTTVFVSTHNNTIGVSNKADRLIYTYYDEETKKYKVYVGNFTDKKLIDCNGEEKNTRKVLMSCMEASDVTYTERRKIYDDLGI